MDTVAIMITSLVNAQRVHKARVAVPYSGFRERIARLLQERGLIADMRVQEGPRPKLLMTLAYDDQDQPRIKGVRSMSTPGRRVYVKKAEIPYSSGDFGFYIVSTPQGLMDDRRARRVGLGGELVCQIW